MTTHTTRMLILGSGPAGLSAAIYGARAGLAPIVVQGIQPGGQLMTTTDVENYPGFKDVIQGPWLMEQMQAQAEHVGTRMMWDTIVEIDLSRRPFRLIGDSGDVYEGDVLVIATGAQAKWLGLDSEEALKGKGVSACATCDGFFFRGKKIAVIGGGNTAVEEALYLTNHSDDVTPHPPPRLVPRREDPAGSAVRAQERQGAVEQGSRDLCRRRRDCRAGRARSGRYRHGRKSRGSMSRAASSRSAIIRRPSCSAGIWSSTATIISRSRPARRRRACRACSRCGDVMDKVYRQAVTAAGTGCMAALDAERFLAEADFEVAEAAE